jgi:hypothetical protein
MANVGPGRAIAEEYVGRLEAGKIWTMYLDQKKANGGSHQEALSLRERGSCTAELHDVMSKR